jgi:hypothetical protein
MARPPPSSRIERPARISRRAPRQAQADDDRSHVHDRQHRGHEALRRHAEALHIGECGDEGDAGDGAVMGRERRRVGTAEAADTA